jgi:hypothetical protein
LIGLPQSQWLVLRIWPEKTLTRFHEFFHKFFGAALDKLSAMFQITIHNVLALAGDEC